MPSSDQQGSDTQQEVQHPPRKRAAGPRFDMQPEFRRETPKPIPVQYPDDPVQRLASLETPRVGPYFVKYSLWAGGAAIAYTYLVGFRALAQQDQKAWTNTFRQRTFIMGPLITMYLTGSGLIPLPFKQKIEQWIGRPAITVQDIDRAERKQKEARKEAAQAAAQRASDEFADKHIAAQQR